MHDALPLPANANLTGRVFGGEQPISAATIYLYEANTNTTGGASTNLLTTTVTTSDGSGVANSNANSGNQNNTLPAGYFTITGDYQCPSATTQVYLAAAGGNPGAGANNAQENLVALGNCGNLSSSTNVVLNELTTVGMVRALSGFMTGYDKVGSTVGNASNLAAAFTTASQYVNPSTGTAPGTNLPSGFDASSNDLRALANAVQFCVNSTGSTSSGQPCASLFGDAQGTAAAVPADTVTALLDIFADPTNNVAAIFNLQSPTPAYAPTNLTAPPDWTLPTLQIPTAPSFSPVGGTYVNPETVSIYSADTDSTAHIYYTTDGTTPTSNSTIYTSSFMVFSNQTVNALVIDDGRLSSPVATAAYTITGSVAPTVSLSSISANFGSTTGISVTASSNNNLSVVTFGTAGSIGGNFSPATCTITSGSCSVTYTPSGTLAVGTYANDLTASFSAYGYDTAASATGTFTINSVTPTESLLVSFTGSSGAAPGANPYYGNLIQGSDGNFYGTTYGGGANGVGVVFKVTPAGALTVLHPFTGTDGGNPYGGLVEGSDGNFYGTTTFNGANSDGVVFKITSTGTYTVLHTFTGSTTDGSNPYDSLVQGSDGSLYGTTLQGGANGVGTVFKITPAGTFTLLYSFGTSATDGQFPYAGLVQGTNGNFYGTANSGGSNGWGTAFQISSTGSFTLLHSFSAATTDGKSPYSGLVQGTDGNFYGTTELGGANNYGTVFKMTPTGSLSLLHSFSTATTDGRSPYASLMEGSDGNFYGTTRIGGASAGGSVFQISSSGAFALQHLFTGGTTDGSTVYSGVAQGADGNFYGMTFLGGASGNGTIYKLVPTSTLSAPVTLSVPASVGPGTAFTLSYTVANAYSDTLQQCFATNTGGDTTGWTGIKTGSPAATNTTLNAPSAAGTYTYTLTCGGMESGRATLNVVAATPTTATVSAVTTPYGSTLGVTVTATEAGSAGPVTGGTVTFGVSGGGSFYPTSCTLSAAGTCTTTYIPGSTQSVGVDPNAIQAYFQANNAYAAVYASNSITVTLGLAYGSLSPVTVPYGSTTPVTISAADFGFSSAVNGSTVTFGVSGSATGSFSPTTCTTTSGTCSVSYIPTGTLAAGTYNLTASFTATSNYTAASATTTLTVTGTTPTVSLSAATVPYQSTTPVTITATEIGSAGTSNGSVVTFGVTGTATGTFSPSSCTIASGSCTVSYVPTGSLATGTYTSDLTASFTASGGYNAASATSTLTVTGATKTVLVNFTGTSGGAPGAVPQYGNLIQASDGNFYGTTTIGGTNNLGTIFKVTPTGTYTVLHSFSNTTTDGEYPYGGLIQGMDGNFYGGTYSGGANGYGALFKISSTGTFTLFYSFSGALDGWSSIGNLVQSADGNFYGTADSGGTYGVGTVFRITPAGALTTLHTFTGAATDGAYPVAGLVQGADGNFYGITANGGANGDGTVFEISPTGTFSLLHSFSTAATDGENPYASLVQAADGSFYGTTPNGGAEGYGTIFKISSTGTFTLLYSGYGLETDIGDLPYGSLVQASDGNLYGTAKQGGANYSGTVFKVSSTGSLASMYSFGSGGATDGAVPLAGLVQGADGNFYGTTSSGGANVDGTIYKLAISPALPAPVTLTVPSSVTHGTSFTLSYTVANAYSATLQHCFATNTAGDSTGWTGIKTGSSTGGSATLTAPSAAGTYTYALTCGGMETGLATLNVQ